MKHIIADAVATTELTLFCSIPILAMVQAQEDGLARLNHARNKYPQSSDVVPNLTTILDAHHEWALLVSIQTKKMKKGLLFFF